MSVDIPNGETLKTITLPSGNSISLVEVDEGGSRTEVVWVCATHPVCNWKKAWNPDTPYPENREHIRAQIAEDWTEHVRMSMSANGPVRLETPEERMRLGRGCP